MTEILALKILLKERFHSWRDRLTEKVVVNSRVRNLDHAMESREILNIVCEFPHGI